MSPMEMDAGRWAVACVDAAVQVPGHPSRMETASTAKPTTPQSLDAVDPVWTLSLFDRQFGDRWVSGTVSLTAEALMFRPRESEPPVPIALLANEIESVDIVSRMFTRFVRIQVAGGQTLQVRCREPYQLAEQLRQTAGVARAAALRAVA